LTQSFSWAFAKLPDGSLPQRETTTLNQQFAPRRGIMNITALRQKKADALAKARAIHALAAKENRLTTAEEDKDFDAAMAEANSYDPHIKRAEALMDAERTAPTVPAASTGTTSVLVGHNNNEDKPWASLADQMRAIRQAKLTPHATDVRLLAAQGGSEAVDADGNFLIAPEFSPEIIRRTFAAGVLASRCKQMPMSSNRLIMNGANDASRADGARNGGVQSFWTYEAKNFTISKPTFRQIALQVDKLTVLTFGTDELLEDGPAWNAYVNDVVPDEMSFKVDDAILNGPGVGGGPLGINNSNAILAIAAESGQATATIVTKNIEKMYARMPGYLRGYAAWFINQDCEPQLWDLTRGSGTAVELLYTPPGLRGNLTSYGVMLGLPVIPIEQAATCGTQGDLTLGAFSQYLLGKRGGVKADTSIHVAFLTGEQAFRWQMRLAGESAWDKPVTPKNGTALQSPFIQLATRP
jgi:HK97 family phage major capsid protein